MFRYARHCACYVDSFQMSGNIMGLACVRMVMGLKCFDMHVIVFVTSRAFK